MIKKLVIISIIFLPSIADTFASKNTIRLGVLAYGTVNWELETMRKQKLDQKHGFQLNITALANPQAAKIALQAGSVDVIVSDWVWVSQQRTKNSLYTFAPYSSTAGALMVSEHSKIKTISDLVGKRLGVAGGELDKNWILLQALAKKDTDIDLNQTIEKVYGAPPILNQQLLQNKIDAVINYWHYAARLEAKGYRRILDGKQIMEELGITERLPTLGYVFDQHWADQYSTSLLGFLQASREAKDLLCSQAPAWQAIIPLTRADDQATLDILKMRYCEGRIQSWGDSEKKAAEQVYRLLHSTTTNRLIGESSTLEPGTFWHYTIPPTQTTD